MTTTENNLRTFDFAGLELRVIMQGDAPWFVANDTCKALGLDVSRGAGRHIRNINPIDVQTYRLAKRGRANTIVSESGLYKLVMRSDKPEARKFQDWVTGDVLPAIRKTGGYLLNEGARDTAKADDRQAMPLPEVFAQIMQEMMAQHRAEMKVMMDALVARLEQQPKAQPAARQTMDLLSAREAVTRFRLPVITSTSKLGADMTDYCLAEAIPFQRSNAKTQTPGRYPAHAFEAYFKSIGTAV